MRFRPLLVLLLAPYVLSAGSIRAAGCDADGKVKYICGMIAPEDIIAVPRSTWVVASGYTAGGAIHLINTRTLATTQVFPTANPKLRLDKKSYASCPGPLDPNEKEKFSAHGLNIRAGSGSVHTLYVVHHGFRESVEVFEIAGVRHEIEAGDALHFMGDQPHHWANEENKPARALWVALRDS